MTCWVRSERATQDEIRKAYWKLAKKLHPDLNPGDKAAEEKFRGTSAAYALLSDEDKRRQFDNREIEEIGVSLQRALIVIMLVRGAMTATVIRVDLPILVMTARTFFQHFLQICLAAWFGKRARHSLQFCRRVPGSREQCHHPLTLSKAPRPI